MTENRKVSRIVLLAEIVAIENQSAKFPVKWSDLSASTFLIGGKMLKIHDRDDKSIGTGKNATRRQEKIWHEMAKSMIVSQRSSLVTPNCESSFCTKLPRLILKARQPCIR